MVGSRMRAIERHEIEADWRARGFSCDMWVDPPGSVLEDFIHDMDELVAVLIGRMEFEIQGQIHHPAIGEELRIPAGSRLIARNIGDTTARWLYGYDKNRRVYDPVRA